ncbi:hypothetical protein VTN00DRAFT_5550 [Thermoascus crustaceus]|uniref:uncharacterized protein n=1 Tax=Thermoascus crustaceus TaxID=5088 RepID=UPI0037437B8A
MKRTRNRGEKVSCCEMGWGGERAEELEVVGRASLLSDSKAGVLAPKQVLAGGAFDHARAAGIVRRSLGDVSSPPVVCQAGTATVATVTAQPGHSAPTYARQASLTPEGQLFPAPVALLLTPSVRTKAQIRRPTVF